MSVLLFVFALIFGVAYYLLKLNTQKNITYNLIAVESNYVLTYTVSDQNAFTAEIITTPQQSNLVYTTSGVTNLTDEQIARAVSTINSGDWENGNFDTFYFKI